MARGLPSEGAADGGVGWCQCGTHQKLPAAECYVTSSQPRAPCLACPAASLSTWHWWSCRWGCKGSALPCLRQLGPGVRAAAQGALAAWYRQTRPICRQVERRHACERIPLPANRRNPACCAGGFQGPVQAPAQPEGGVQLQGTCIAAPVPQAARRPLAAAWPAACTFLTKLLPSLCRPTHLQRSWRSTRASCETCCHWRLVPARGQCSRGCSALTGKGLLRCTCSALAAALEHHCRRHHPGCYCAGLTAAVPCFPAWQGVERPQGRRGPEEPARHLVNSLELKLGLPAKRP